MVFGIVALVAVIYLLDHASKGETAVFSGVERRISEQDFRGTQCTAIFGACKFDLRDAQMQGSEAVLETYAVFGGIEIRVPDDWKVVNRGFALFGALSDKRRRQAEGPATKTLILDGAAVFGAVEVKD